VGAEEASYTKLEGPSVAHDARSDGIRGRAGHTKVGKGVGKGRGVV
jgi:hypothetical protein